MHNLYSEKTMETIYYANLESRSFSFSAVGLSEQQAKQALIDGLNRHTKKFNLDPNWYDIESDIGVVPMQVGVPYRDYQSI